MSVSEKKVVVVGGSRGLGRAIVATAHSAGARVLAAGRERDSLARLSDELPGVMTLPIDATDENSPTRLFDLLQPDILVICAGVLPHMAPLHDQSWEEFSRNWDSDVRISFLFCRAALLLPLSSGTTIILISSGAAIGGSPLSGSYAGAKRMQMFLAKYCQKEADRLNLGLRFLALAPMRPMPDTRLGQIAVEGYAKYQGITSSDFLKRMGTRQTPEDVANGLMRLATEADTKGGNVFGISAEGIESLP